MMEPGTLASEAVDFFGRRLSRLIWLSVILIALLAIGIATVPWTFSTAALRDEVATQIQQATGLSTLARGKAIFALLPQPHIKIDQISFGDATGSLHIDADYFKGNLRILPLFVGRLEIASATLLKPRLLIDLDRKPISQNSAIGRAAVAKPESTEAAEADTARLGTVSLVNGTADLKTRNAASDIVIDNIDMTLEWRNLNAPASLTGKARIRGEFGDIAAWVAEPAEVLRGGRSEMTLEVKTELLSLTTNGLVSGAPKPEFAGHLRAASLDFPKLLDLIGYSIPRSSVLKHFRVTCDTKANADGMSLSNLNLHTAESDFEGSLAIAAGGDQRPQVSGTLATELLALDPFFAHQRITEDGGRWSEAPFDLRTWTTANLDVRISAARARLARFEMQDAALSLMTHANRMDLSLAEAKAYRGVIKARATLTLAEDGIDFHAASSITDLDAGALSWDKAGFVDLTGTASGTANIEATGRTFSDLVQSAGGRLQLSLKQGDVRGADLEWALHPNAAGHPARPADALAVRVPYEQAQVAIKVSQGIAEVEQGLADGTDGHVLLSGSANLPARQLDLRAVILPAVATDQRPSAGQDRNILIKGSWDHPLMTATP